MFIACVLPSTALLFAKKTATSSVPGSNSRNVTTPAKKTKRDQHIFAIWHGGHLPHQSASPVYACELWAIALCPVYMFTGIHCTVLYNMPELPT